MCVHVHYKASRRAIVASLLLRRLKLRPGVGICGRIPLGHLDIYAEDSLIAFWSCVTCSRQHLRVARCCTQARIRS